MKICFAFAITRGFSGQAFATQMLVDSLRSSVECVELPFPTWNGSMRDLPRYVWGVLKTWLRIPFAVRNSSAFYLNAGQSSIALFRDGIILFLAKCFNRKCRLFIALHGNLFSQWQPASLMSRTFVKICNVASVVTVLGPHQRERLKKLGVRSRIEIVDNRIDPPPIGEQELSAKHQCRPLNLLFLSNLLESKGYPEFLETLKLLAESSSLEIEATLAGDFIRDPYPSRFLSHKDAEFFVTTMIAAINRTEHVRVRWVKGVSGKQKVDLLRSAQILVFPSSYPVEAQPFVLIEAMSFGIAIIASKNGEIPSMLEEGVGLLLEDLRPHTIAEAVTSLSKISQRKSQAVDGLLLFNRRFTLRKHVTAWRRLLLG